MPPDPPGLLWHAISLQLYQTGFCLLPISLRSILVTIRLVPIPLHHFGGVYHDKMHGWERAALPLLFINECQCTLRNKTRGEAWESGYAIIIMYKVTPCKVTGRRTWSRNSDKQCGPNDKITDARNVI